MLVIDVRLAREHHTRTGDERFNYLPPSTPHSASARSVYQINWGPRIKYECVHEEQQQTNMVITSQANLILWLQQHCYFYASIVFSLKPSPEISPNQCEFYTFCVSHALIREERALCWRNINTVFFCIHTPSEGITQRAICSETKHDLIIFLWLMLKVARLHRQ